MTWRRSLGPGVKWGGLGLTVLIAAAWIGHIRWCYYFQPCDAFGIACGEGRLVVTVDEDGQDASRGFWIGRRYFDIESPRGFRVRLFFVASRGLSDAKRFDIPLWVILAPIAACTALGWWWPIRRALRKRREQCPRCGYSRTGLDRGALCPECGADRWDVSRS